MKSAGDARKTKSSCLTQALKFVSFEPLYHTRKELFQDKVSPACEGIEVRPEVQGEMEKAASELSVDFTKKVELKVLELAKAKADGCITKYPLDTNLNRIRSKSVRDACLLNEWPSFEAEAVRAHQGEAQAHGMNEMSLRSAVEGNRRRLQIRVMRDLNF
jgi:hypothetical protein